MPTITFSFSDLSKLVGKKLSREKLEHMLSYAKAELDSVSGDNITIKLNDTNLPYLWSVEGLARLFRGVLGLKPGKPLKPEKAGLKLFAESSVRSVRPFIAAFAAKGQKIDAHLLEQMIQLQEKLCDNYGRRRRKVAVGLYPLKKIAFPVRYKAVQPTSSRFIPLEFRAELNLKEILREHPKGREYGWILEDQRKFPILVDSKRDVLSFPPIINSETTGKLEPGEDEIFFEATGTDMASVKLAANIFAYALADRGFKIYSVDIIYAGKKITTPDVVREKIKFNFDSVRSILGMKLSDTEIKKLLVNAGYSVGNNVVEIPTYRQDIMHSVDVVEDVAIMYGYDKITPLQLTSYTTGRPAETAEFADKFRELMIGLDYQEIMSSILSNKDSLHEKMEFKSSSTVEISNAMSQTHSAVRSWLLPVLLEMLSKNKHSDYPQKMFEQGIVTTKTQKETCDTEKLASVSAHANADFTEAKKIVECLLRSMGISYNIQETAHPSFIKGRLAKVVVNGNDAGFFGEIHPQVLVNWGLETPVAALELDLTELMKFQR